MRTRLRRGGLRLSLLGLLVGSVMLTLVVSSALAGGGNSANAKLCQKNGWQTLVRADGSAFANEPACVSYGAKGGVFYPASAAPCLGTGYQTKATANGDPFASAEACVAYMTANPGELVSCTQVGTSGDDTIDGVVGPAVVCGFGGNDTIDDVRPGVTFYGGAGNDRVSNVVSGSGVFIGGSGNDFAQGVQNGGTFLGGEGDDRLNNLSFSTYNGGPDTDTLCSSVGTVTITNVEVIGCS